MDERVRYWIELSDYDLETADAMLATGRYLYVGFMCHQTIEKALKGWYQSVKRDVPPRTHNLRLLLKEVRGADPLPSKKLSFVLELEPLNVATRYPENRQRLEETLGPERCARLLTTTREFQSWIKRKL